MWRERQMINRSDRDEVQPAMSNELGGQLIGRWITDPDDEEALKTYGQVTLVFEANGSLRYIVRGEKKDEIMLLKYRIENGNLITDQLSTPREEHTPFTLAPDGKLVLQYGQVQSRYVREELHRSVP